jgi:hypothetical protein
VLFLRRKEIKMEDKAYEYQEYPKWVYLTDGPQESYEPGKEPVLVEDAKAERKAKKVAAAEPDKPAEAQ